MSKLPKWVWDLVMNLQKQEYEHPTLYVGTSSGVIAQAEWCPGRALDLVPDDIKKRAESIREYLDQIEAGKDPEPDVE